MLHIILWLARLRWLWQYRCRRVFATEQRLLWIPGVTVGLRVRSMRFFGFALEFEAFSKNDTHLTRGFESMALSQWRAFSNSSMSRVRSSNLIFLSIHTLISLLMERELEQTVFVMMELVFVKPQISSRPLSTSSLHIIFNEILVSSPTLQTSMRSLFWLGLCGKAVSTDMKFFIPHRLFLFHEDDFCSTAQGWDLRRFSTKSANVAASTSRLAGVSMLFGEDLSRY